jgi:predicted nucleic acid-binding protein
MRTEWFLLDSGVWIAAGSPGEQFESAAQKVLADSCWDVAALDLTLYEVTNVIGARRGDVAGAAMLCRSIQVRCRESLIQVDNELIESTAELAVEHGLTSYDAAYVAAARRHDWQLISTDIKDLVSKGLAITPDAAV